MFEFSKNNQELTPVTYSSAAIKILPYSVRPNTDCFRIHWHDRMEFLRIHKGTMFATYGANTITVSPGEMILFPPKMPHHARSGNEQLEYDVLMFDVRSFYNDSDICKSYLPPVYNGRAKFEALVSHPETIACFDNIIAKSECNSFEILADIYRFLYLLFEHNLLEIQTGHEQKDIVRDIVEYLEENFMKDISTASLCEQFGYTAPHFCRKFKEGTGLTPMNYLKIRRMEEAYKLLKKGNHNINEVAIHCGYDDSNYFTRCFKSHFGIPPSQIKQK